MNDRLLQSAFALLVPIGSAAAQWHEGELIVDTYLLGTGAAFVRVDPVSGNSQILFSGHYSTAWPGASVFDAHRSALLVSTSLPPDPYWLDRLWSVQSNGTASPIAGIANLALKALCSAGDGRVFYQHASPASDEIHWLDAANGIHTLLDASGTNPFVFPVEHMLWHAPSNSLLATTSAVWSTNTCVAGSCSIFRIPLSFDGTRIASAPVCAPIATASQEIMSMDHLPGGDVLLCLGSGTSPVYPNLLLRVDPGTLAATPYASPSVGDLNGACYCPNIGRVVVLDDGANVLRTYLPGGSGGGTVLATNLAVSPGSSGYSPRETMWKVDTNGPGCAGAAIAYGTGLAGAGGFVPTLGVAGCPAAGTPFTLSIELLVGGTIGVIGLGDGPAAIPALGGTLLIFPVVATVVVVAGGAPLVPGAGNAGLPLLVADPSLIGLAFWFQGAFLDAAAAQGWSLTNGLQLVIG